MPGVVHSLDDSPNDERLAFATTGGKQDVKVVLAILALLELEENPVFERLQRSQMNDQFNTVMKGFRPMTNIREKASEDPSIK